MSVRFQLRSGPQLEEATLARPAVQLEHAVDTRCPSLRQVLWEAERLGSRGLSCVIVGETGVGKELVARAYRGDRTWIDVNCAQFTDGLVDSELFGHERGSFTGATDARQGLFEVAAGGVVFLDEVRHLSLRAQAKLLRVLETNQVRRVGSYREREVSFSLVSATSAELPQLVEDGSFLPDLMYRLGHVLRVPPLRTRPMDVTLLAPRFLDAGFTLSPDAELWLSGRRWPGNVRQLKQLLQTACALAEHGVVDVELLSRLDTGEGLPPRLRRHAALLAQLDEMERVLATTGSVAEAGAVVGKPGAGPLNKWFRGQDDVRLVAHLLGEEGFPARFPSLFAQLLRWEKVVLEPWGRSKWPLWVVEASRDPEPLI